MRYVFLLAWPMALVLAEDLERQATAMLAKQCVNCHNSSSRMGGLVLETRESALRGGFSGPALTPGDAGRSLLAARVAKGEMPPGNPLPADARRLLARWVESGASWTGRLLPAARKRAGKDWWSLQPLRRVDPEIPADAPASWTVSPIDRYLLAAMRERGLSPSPPAAKRTLARRVTYDLTGLPPTPEELDAFLRDDAPDAYERLVDRLLASPAYGERWARHWMDVIRFGESHGYEQNHLRPNAWPFRDYLIRSFNAGKPFDRMILEHLAGDVIAGGDPDVEVGVGFLVAGVHDTVGNQAEAPRRQQRADDLDDMIAAAGSAFLGLTVHCARCHDHKFDPIEQRDYYRMAAIFNGVVHGERELAAAAEKERHAAAREPWERALREVRERLAAIREAARPEVAAQREAILAAYRPPVSDRFTEERFAAVRAKWIRLRITGTPNNSPAAIDEMEVWEGSRNVALASAGARVSASSERRADDDPEAYAARHLIDGRFDRRWFAASGGPVEITIELAAPALVDRVSWSRDREGGFQGKFAGPPVTGYVVEASADGRAWRPVASAEGRLPYSPAEREALVLRAVLPEAQRREWETLEARRAELEDRLAKFPKLPVAYIGRAEQPREPVYLLKGGNVMDRAGVVTPASLSAFSFARFSLEEEQPEGERRVALARWLTDARNPLTPRVLANRIWHYHFGRGIVGTPSDFGFQGEAPSHPALLDYLALRLLAHGWRLKPLHREILLSQAYRQSSAFDEGKARVDAEARLLWRYPPQRLSAEAIRDAILAVSGALDRRMGGPGFHLFRYTVDNVATYYPLERFGPETFRRAVYQTAARSVRSELLGQYDCPDSSLPEPKRSVTTSPLQALALFNNSFVIEQAELLAGRLRKEAGADPARQVDWAFVLAFGRPAEPGERAAAAALVERHGLAAFCRALFNANEFIYVM